MHFLYFAYYYPPCNSVSSYRPLSHVKSLLKKGHSVTVITRNWKGDEKGWADYVKPDTRPETIFNDGKLTVYNLPFKEPIQVSKFKPLNKIRFLVKFLQGNFHTEINASTEFYNKANELMLKQKFDCIVLSSPPLNLLKAAHKLYGKHKVKIVADFRDLWDSNLLIRNYPFTLSDRLKNKITSYYFRKWTKGSHVKVTTVSDVLAGILTNENKKLTGVYLNGFEDELMAEVKKKEYTKFTFSSIGTMYAYYNTDNLIKGLSIFLKNKSPEKVTVCFIGITAVPEVAQRINEGLPPSFLRISDRVPKSEALEILKSSHVLFHTAVKEFQGAYTTKIFDYVGSGNNVLISPGDDGGIIDSLVTETRSGKIAKSPEEFAQILEEWYRQWDQSKVIHYEGISSKIMHYSRSVQAHNFTTDVINWLT